MGETEKVPGIIFLSQRVRAPHRISFDHGERSLEPVPFDTSKRRLPSMGEVVKALKVSVAELVQ